ncbi:MAG: 4-hydroxythreonine-4-phosphate dehydrogenase PdxA [Bacteroidota bacterium]
MTKIGISVGDINGISIEVILKALADKRLLEYCTPVIYGSSKVISYHKNITELEDLSFHSAKHIGQIRTKEINVINCVEENVNISLGALTEEAGRFAMLSLEAATNDLKEGKIDALVTAPIHKKAMNMAGFGFPGHTEYLAHAFETSRDLMLMVSDELKVGLVTNHLPLRDVADSITKDLIMKKIQVLNDALRIDYGIEKPKIAVLALNPHASDEGVMGSEEANLIIPAVKDCKRRGIMAIGPYPADGFFGSGQAFKFDAILAMYHDQGLIPFKALSFGKGVNHTIGLPVVRTSPDHGTGHDIAGQNIADPSSFREAIFRALDVVRNRANYVSMTRNPVTKVEQETEEPVD